MSIEDNFFVQDSAGRNYEIVCVSEEQFAQFKNSDRLTRCQDLQSKFGISAYQLDSGGIVVEEGRYYALYPSAAVLKLVLDKNGATPYSKEILQGVNRFGREFPMYANELIMDLVKELGIPYKSSIREDFFNLQKKFPLTESFETIIDIAKF